MQCGISGGPFGKSRAHGLVLPMSAVMKIATTRRDGKPRWNTGDPGSPKFSVKSRTKSKLIFPCPHDLADVLTIKQQKSHRESELIFP